MTVVFVNWRPWQGGGKPKFVPSQPDEAALGAAIRRADRTVFCFVDHMPNEGHSHELHLRHALGIEKFENSCEGDVPLVAGDMVVHVRWERHHRKYTLWTLQNPATVVLSEASAR